MSGIYKSEAGARAVGERYAEILKSWPVPNRELRVPTREGETFAIACGSENAPPLLQLHGSAANSAMWMGDVAAWAKEFRIYAVDMIGEPGGSAPSRPPLASDAHALWLDDVLQGLSLDRVSIVGVSLGGWLALDYATRRPQRVTALALLCPAGVGGQKNFLLKALPLLLLGSWGARRMRQMVLGRAPAELSPAQRQMADFTSLIFTHFRPRIVNIPIFGDDALMRLTMPVLAILGGKDVLLDSADTMRRLKKAVPHAGIVYLPGARHYIPGQTATILDFLRRAKTA
jgi:pimeloyl-ACP methyl ester carboxylesterase